MLKYVAFFLGSKQTREEQHNTFVMVANQLRRRGSGEECRPRGKLIVIDGVDTYLNWESARIQMKSKINKVWEKLKEVHAPGTYMDICIAGHSRGGATSILFAEALSKKLRGRVQIHLLLLDPVSKSHTSGLIAKAKLLRVRHCWTVYMQDAAGFMKYLFKPAIHSRLRLADDEVLLQPGKHNSLVEGSSHGRKIGRTLLKYFLKECGGYNLNIDYQGACRAYQILWEKYGHKAGFPTSGHPDRQEVHEIGKAFEYGTAHRPRGCSPYVANKFHFICLKLSFPELSNWLLDPGDDRLRKRAQDYCNGRNLAKIIFDTADRLHRAAR